MGGLSIGLRPEWLALRESADAAARSTELLDPLRRWLTQRHDTGLVVRDLGCGTGSMGRWLAGRLPGPQHWVLHDRDPDLLTRAIGTLPATVTVSAELGDLTELNPADLAGTSLVTASALLDLLTETEVATLAAACVAAGCPALLTLTVLGRVAFEPADPLDADLAAAFNGHQRRLVAGRRLLGPDAFEVAAERFGRGAVVLRRSSPWRLGPPDAALAAEWLRGWVSAAVEHSPGLAGPAAEYLERRLADAAAGRLGVVVEHGDLLVLPEVAP